MALASPKDEEPAGFSVSYRPVDQDMVGSGRAAHGSAASSEGSALQQSSLSLMDLAGFSNEAHSSTLVDVHHKFGPYGARDGPSNQHGRESTDQAGPVVRHSRGAYTASHVYLDTQLRLKRAASIRCASLGQMDSLRIAQSASGADTPGPPPHESEVPLPAGAMDLVAAGTLAGAGRPGYRDGELMHALFDEPGDACLLPGGAVLVADMRNSCLRVVRVDRRGAGNRSARPRSGRGATAFPSKPGPNSDKDGSGEGTGNVFPGEVLTLDSCSLLRPRAPLMMGPSRIVLVCDSGHHKIRMLQLQEDISWTDGASLAVHDSVLAGSGRRGLRDGPADRAEFDAPSGLCLLPDGSILVSDTGNHCIRRIAGRAGRGGLFVSTVAGAARGEESTEQESVASVQQPAAAGERYLPLTDRSQLFQTAAEHYHESKPTDGGRRNQRWRDGNGSTALFHRPESMVYDAVSGLVLVADVGNSCVRAVLPPSTSQRGTTMDCVDPAEYEVTTVAGCPGQPGHRDGPGPAARFGRLGQLALAEDGSILVADSGARCVRGIVQSSHNAFGEVKTVAGVPHTGQDSRKASIRYKDGAARRAKFGKPAGLCVVPASNGCLLVSDATNNHLRVLISRQASRRPPRAVARSLPPTADRTEGTQMPARQSSASVVDSLQAMGRGAATGSHAEGSAIRALLAGPGSPGGFALGTLSFRRGGGSGGTVGLGSGFAGSMRYIAFGLHEDEAGIDLVSRLQASVRALGTSAVRTTSGDGVPGAQYRALSVAVDKGEHVALVKHITDKLWSTSAHDYHRHRPAEGPHRGAPAAMQSAPVLDHLGIAVRGSLGLPGQPRVLMSSHVRRTAVRKSAAYPGTHSTGSQANSRPRGSATKAKNSSAATGGSPFRERPAKPLASALLAHQVAAAHASRESPAIAFGKTLPAGSQLTSPRTGHEAGGTPDKTKALAMNRARDSRASHSRAGERGSRALAREFVRANSPESRAIRYAQQHAATVDDSEKQRPVSQSSEHALAQDAPAGSEEAGKGSPKPASSPKVAFVHPSVRGMPGDDAVYRTRTAMRALATSSLGHEDSGPGREKLRDSSLDEYDEEQAEAPFHAPKESLPGNDCVSKVIEDAITFVLEQAGDEPSQSDRDRAEGLHQRLHYRLLALNLDVGIGSEAAVLLSSCSLLDMVERADGRYLESGKRKVPSISDVTRILRRAAQLDEQARLGKDSRAASTAQPTDAKPPVGPRLAGNGPRAATRHSHAKAPQSARGSASAESSELSWSLASDAADVAAQDTTKPASGLPRYQQPTVAAVQRARSSGIRLRPDSLSYGWRARHRGTASWVEASEKEARKTGNPVGKQYSNGVSGMTPEAVHRLAVQRLEGTRGPGGRTLPDTKSAYAQLGASGHLMTRRSVEVQYGTLRGSSSALVQLPSRHDHSSGTGGMRASARASHGGPYLLSPSNRVGLDSVTVRAGGISPTHVPIDHPRDAWIKQAPLDLEVATTPAFATQRGGGHVGIETFVEHAARYPAYASGRGEIRSAPPAVDEIHTRRHFVQSHAAVQAYHPAMQLRPHEADMRRAVAGAASSAVLGRSGRASPLRQVQSLPAYSVPSPTKAVGETAQGGRRVRFAP